VAPGGAASCAGCPRRRLGIPSLSPGIGIRDEPQRRFCGNGAAAWTVTRVRIRTTRCFVGELAQLRPDNPGQVPSAGFDSTLRTRNPSKVAGAIPARTTEDKKLGVTWRT
jgi:hypothetical protein